MNLKELVQAVSDWAEARNLIKGSDPKTQTLKTVSEFGEVAEGVSNENRAMIIDGVGDTIVTCIIAGKQMGFDLYDAIKGPAAETDSAGQDVFAVIDAADVLGKMCDNVIKGQTDKYIANFGQFCNLLSSIAVQYDATIHDCLQDAYDEIKDRRGVMYHGAFVKDSDPRFDSAVAELKLEA